MQNVYDNNKDYENRIEKYFLRPGFVYVSKTPSKITTILGSCISICLFDAVLKYGGMNHFIFPFNNNNELHSTKYGNTAMKTLIKLFFDFGSEIKNLQATVLGGAYLDGIRDSKTVSEQNISIAKEILKANNIKIINETTGGIKGRKIEFYTEINKINIITNKDIDLESYSEEKNIFT